MKKIEMGGTCSMYGGEERCIQGFDGKTREKESLGRPWDRWNYNIKLDL
jgi:hypothetical protein